MSRHLSKCLLYSAATVCTVACAIRAEAVTTTFNREVEVNNIDTNNDTVDDDGNRPFFPDNYNNGTITFTNPDGYTGTATPGTSNSSTVTGVGLGLGGDNTNALPMGIGVNYEMMFTVQTTGAAGGVLMDTGSNGIGVNSTAQQTDSNTTQLSNNEQLLFSAIALNNVSFQDPLGLLAPGATITPKWTAMRSSNHAAGDVATTSTDAAVTTDVTTFNTATSIENNYTNGLISPTTGLTGPFYLTTTAGAWSLKGLRYRLELNYELAPVPASRRTFLFADSLTTPVYDNLTTHQITASGDTTMTITAVGNTAVFDTNDIGAGVNSVEDDALGDAGERRIDGSLPTPEAINVSFDKDVSLESITVGSFNLSGLEGMRLAFVSGTNPFANSITGYSSDYVFDSTSVTFKTSAGGQTPYLIPFGIGTQDEITIAAGTVLSITANPSHTDGGVLLDMITVHSLAAPGVPGDYNSNGTVDAADYVHWRNGGPLANEVDAPGTVNDADYDAWRARFGNPGGGSGSGSAIPEPCSAMLLVLWALWCGALRSR